MRIKNRTAAVVLSVLFVLLILATISFIAVESEHECCGEKCPICSGIQACEDFLRALYILVIAVIAIAAVCKFFAKTLSFFADRITNFSLVLFKIKLSD